MGPLGMLYESGSRPLRRGNGFPRGPGDPWRQQSTQAHLFRRVTPDLYVPKYQAKVAAFFDKLLDTKYAEKPFMRHYLDYYWDIYRTCISA